MHTWDGVSGADRGDQWISCGGFAFYPGFVFLTNQVAPVKNEQPCNELGCTLYGFHVPLKQESENETEVDHKRGLTASPATTITFLAGVETVVDCVSLQRLTFKAKSAES